MGHTLPQASDAQQQLADALHQRQGRTKLGKLHAPGITKTLPSLRLHVPSKPTGCVLSNGFREGRTLLWHLVVNTQTFHSKCKGGTPLSDMHPPALYLEADKECISIKQVPVTI